MIDLNVLSGILLLKQCVKWRYLVEEIQHIDVRVYKIEKKQNNFIFDSIYDNLVQ